METGNPIGEKIIEAITPKMLFEIHLPGISIPVSDTVAATWFVMALLITAALILTRRKMESVPKGRQNYLEAFIEFSNSFGKNTMGRHWQKFTPYIGTVLLFLLAANSLSILNVIPTASDLYRITGWEFFTKMPDFAIKPPTRDINVTASLALMSMAFVAYAGVKARSAGGYLRSFTKPNPILMPFRLFDFITRPMSMCFRLFGNILGSVIIMELIYLSIPAFLPGALSIYFDIFDGFLQAYVFVFLTTVFASEAVGAEEEEEEEAEAKAAAKAAAKREAGAEAKGEVEV